MPDIEAGNVWNVSRSMRIAWLLKQPRHLEIINGNLKCFLRDDFFDDIPGHIGQPEITAIESIRQLFVIHAHQG